MRDLLFGQLHTGVPPIVAGEPNQVTDITPMGPRGTRRASPPSRPRASWRSPRGVPPSFGRTWSWSPRRSRSCAPSRITPRNSPQGLARMHFIGSHRQVSPEVSLLAMARGVFGSHVRRIASSVPSSFISWSPEVHALHERAPLLEGHVASCSCRPARLERGRRPRPPGPVHR